MRLLFCLSQFVVDLFTFLLVPHRLLLHGHLPGAPLCYPLLIFGSLHRRALA